MDLKNGLVSVKDLSKENINRLVSDAKMYRYKYSTGNKSSNELLGKTVVNIFLEPSTRTRLSFELAAKRMGADVTNIIADASAMTKGESMVDTVLTLSEMDTDVIVIRCGENELPYHMTRYTNAAVLNAGDGTNEHPTQALLDYFSAFRHNPNFKKIAIVGDIVRSRVARSNILLMLKMGCDVHLVGPEGWLPNEFKHVCTYHNDLSCIGSMDIVMALRVQKERFSDIHRKSLDLKNYNENFGIKKNMLSKEQLLMHPGPVNRNIEVDDDVLYSSNSIILDQVKNGLAIRSALLNEVVNS